MREDTLPGAMVGDGLRVVAVEPNVSFITLAGGSGDRDRGWEPGTEVEAALDDGRVVTTVIDEGGLKGLPSSFDRFRIRDRNFPHWKYRLQ